MLAALVCDGLGLIANTKAAVVRLGLAEMTSFSRIFYPSKSHTHTQAGPQLLCVKLVLSFCVLGWFSVFVC